jgi:hypothetical protein
MNPQLTYHGYLHHDGNFHEVAEEFIMDGSNEHDIAEAPRISSGGHVTDHGYLHSGGHFYEVAEEFIMANEVSDHDIAEAPQISSGGRVAEHSDSQGSPRCPEEDGCTTVTEHSADLHVPKGSSSDILSSQEQENQKSLVQEKEASIPSQNLQDQQPPPVERLCSNHPRLEEVGKIMAENLQEHQTVMAENLQEHQTANHDGKPTEALRPPNSEAEEKNSEEKVIPPNNRDTDEKDDTHAIGSSHNPHPRRFCCATKTLVSVVVSTFAVIMVGKLLRRS